MIVGPGSAATVMENAGSDAVALPSLTEITIPEYTPTFAVCGVPESCPVVVLKAAQLGLLAIAKLSAVPLGWVALGVKL